MEIVEDLAFPLPVTVISEMIGVPIEDHPQLRAWTAEAVKLLDPNDDIAEMLPATGAVREMREYFDVLVEKRRKDLGDDLLSAHRRRGRGRSPHPRRADRHDDPAVRCRPRDDREPHLRRHAQPPASSRSAAATAGRPVVDRHRGRGAPALRPARPVQRAHRDDDVSNAGVERRATDRADRRRQPRPGGVRRSRVARHRPAGQPPPVVRRRHPPLLGAPLAQVEGQEAISHGSSSGSHQSRPSATRSPGSRPPRPSGSGVCGSPGSSTSLRL